MILSDINPVKNNEFSYSLWFNTNEFYPNQPGSGPRDYQNFNYQGLFSINSNDWDVGPTAALFLKNNDDDDVIEKVSGKEQIFINQIQSITIYQSFDDFHKFPPMDEKDES